VLVAAHLKFGTPLLLLGGRCPAHDDHADTVDYHRTGRAADVRVRGVSSEKLMAWLVQRGVGGAGRYKQAGFVHIDVRPGSPEHWEAQERPPPQEMQAQEPAPPTAGQRTASPGQASEPAAPTQPPTGEAAEQPGTLGDKP
jgi:hypothetical protein